MRTAALQVWESDYGAEYEVTEASATPYPEFLPRAANQPPSPLDKFRALTELDDVVPPTNYVIDTAERVLDRSAAADMKWDRIAAIPDGGLAIYFFGADRTTNGTHRLVARLALDNDSAATLLLEDVAEQRTSLTDEEIDDDDLVDEVLDRIKSHTSR